MGILKWFRSDPEPNGRVRMTHSVGDYIAGEQYDLPITLADEYIVKGYAQGDLSREFDDIERHSITHLNQRVGV